MLGNFNYIIFINSKFRIKEYEVDCMQHVIHACTCFFLKTRVNTKL
jgi:hypothetical protein